MDIVVVVFAVRGRGRVDLWVDIAVVMLSVAGFCNKKIVKFILNVKRKTYAKLTSGNIGTLFSQYHYYCKNCPVRNEGGIMMTS